MFKRIACLVLGHDRRVLLQDVMRAVALMHLYTWAGCLTKCQRCGAVDDDLSNDARAHFRSIGLYPLEE